MNKSELSLLNNWKNRLTTVRKWIFTTEASFRKLYGFVTKGWGGSLTSLVTIVAHYPSQYCAQPCIADGSIEPENLLRVRNSFEDELFKLDFVCALGFIGFIRIAGDKDRTSGLMVEESWFCFEIITFGLKG